MESTEKTKPALTRRRWFLRFRFSLRTLLIFVLLVGSASGSIIQPRRVGAVGVSSDA
jgi:hypothetical protein